jgi:hypothetical protein
MGMFWMGPRCCCCDDDYPLYELAGVFGQDRANPPPNEFPREKWGVDFLSQVRLVDYLREVKTPIVDFEPKDPRAVRPRPGSDDESGELDYLMQLSRDNRQRAFPEIRAQDTGFPFYFVRLLDITERSHPKTYLALKCAARVGETAMVCLKAKYARPRPSELLPALFPPMEFHHPSYPSGHSLVAHLMAYCAAYIWPDMHDTFVGLANQIGANREIAGLHFPSDTAAGVDFAKQLFQSMLETKTMQTVLEEAKSEYASAAPA